MSNTNSLNKQDMKEWAVQTIIYSVIIPVLLTFLTSLQNGVDFKTAAMLGVYSLVSALVNLLGKYQAGNPQVTS